MPEIQHLISLQCKNMFALATAAAATAAAPAADLHMAFSCLELHSSILHVIRLSVSQLQTVEAKQLRVL